ncbi:MAG: DJ-1/PfpI family protein, partial [Myxococcota bacterium]
MQDRVLIALTSHDRLGDTGRSTGAYLPEAALPWRVFTDAGFAVDLVSVQGGPPPMIGSADDPDVRAFLDDPHIAAQLADAPRAEALDPSDYRAIFYAGGHGTMWDFPEAHGLAALASRIYAAGGVVSAVCHGPAGLLPVRLPDGRPLVDGKAVAAFTDEEEADQQLTDIVPFLLAPALAALGARPQPGARYQPRVVTDGRLVTGQNPASSAGVAHAVVRVLRGEVDDDAVPVVSDVVTLEGTLRAYVAAPVDGGGDGVIVGPTLFGVDGHARALADRLAGTGRIAVVPDPYHRAAPLVALRADDAGRARGRELLGGLTREEVAADLGLAAGGLRARGAGRVDMVGVSSGGHLAWIGAAL